MKKSKGILLLLRLPFLTVTFGAVLLGTAYAKWDSGQINWLYALLAFLGAALLHIACNVANDYFDHKSGNDARNISGMTPFSGGSRMLTEGFVKPGEALAVSLIFAALGGAAGLVLNFSVKGNVVLWIGIAALFFVYSYNGFPARLVNFGLGEIAIYIAWGPLMVLGAYYVQAESLPSPWFYAAASISGILTTLVLLINEFADKEADQSSGRKTWVILLGYQKGMVLYLLFALICFALLVLGVLFGGWPLWSLASFLTLPLALTGFKIGKTNMENWPEFLPAVKNTILLNLVFLVLLSVTFFI